MKVKLVEKPTTKPPGQGTYVAVQGPGGKEQWLQVATDAEDVTDADFNFDKGKQWAAQQKKDQGK